MATEPRKPKFTNHKVLKTVRNLLVGLSLAGIIGTFLWTPALVIGMGLLMVAYLPEGALMRLRAWERAQWVPVQSRMDRVKINILRPCSAAEIQQPVAWEHHLEVILFNGDTVKVPWELFAKTGLDPTRKVLYKVRTIEGVREFDSVTIE